MTRAEQLVQQVLNAARASIVVESTSAIQGPPPSPNAPAPPDTRTMQATLVQQAGVINAQSITLQQQQATIAAFPQLLTDAISLNNTQFVMPALQAILGGTLPGALDSLKELVTQLQADEAGAATMLANATADRTRFAQLEPLVASLGTNFASLNATVATKAAASDVAALLTAVNTKASATDLSTLSTTVAGKASAGDVAALQTTVQGIPAAIVQAKQDVKTELLGGAGAAYDTLQELAALELNAENVTQALTLRVGTVEGVVNNAVTGLAAVNTALGTKALASDLATSNTNIVANTAALALRATTASVAALSTAVDGKASIGSVTAAATTAAQGVTDAATQKTRVDGLITTTVPQLQADTALRLLRSGDTATGQIVVPTAFNKLAAPRFEQIFGGINSPRRTMAGITTGTSQLVPLTDTTGQNRQILPVGIQFLLTGSLGLLSSVTVKLGTTSGGAELYTKTYSILTGLLGKVTTIDQPTSATPLPAGQMLYATIVGGGQWTVFFDAVFLPTAS